MDDIMADVTIAVPAAQFIGALYHARTPVYIFLLSGVKLHGVITSYTEDRFVLELKNRKQLVMTHAVATIMPDTV